MRTLRKTTRIIKVIFWTLFSFFFSLKASRKKEKWAAVSAMTEKVSCWCRGLLKICDIELVIHGDAQKSRGALIVSNHSGYVDILTHAAAFPIRFAPKAELRKAPVFGFLTAMSHPVWVDRKNRMRSAECAAEFLATLEHKIPLLVYPEGTTSDGKNLLPFKTGPFEPAVKGNFPILPVLTFYSVPEGEFSPGWFDDTEMTDHIWKFLGIKKIRADIYILPEISVEEGSDRKILAEKVFAVMTEKYKELQKENSNKI